MTGRERIPEPTCPVCGMAHRSDDTVCRNCGLPVAEASDPMRGVAPGQPKNTMTGSSRSATLAGLAIALALVLVGGTFATSGGGVLLAGGRLGFSDATPPPPLLPAEAPSPALALTARTIPEDAVDTVEVVDSTGPFTCDDTAFRTFRARWRITGILAGPRKGFERVTIRVGRAGTSKKATRVEVAWMDPVEARRMFGLPRFAGKRGILLTFAGPTTTSATQLIGPTDLRNAGLDSLGGVYRFIDADGLARMFVAVRDGSCVRMRAPKVKQGQRGKGPPRITLDFRKA